MKKIYIQNLGMIITNKCNLNCDHCLRGEKCDNKSMSDEIIKKTLDQICAIGNLCICGGEPTLALDRLEKIFSYIIDNNIYVSQVSMVINGTIYSQKFINLLGYIDSFINYKSFYRQSLTGYSISCDTFHLKEIRKLQLLDEYLENVRKYKEYKYFLGMQDLDKKLFNEGNATKLNHNMTVPLRPMDTVMTYVSNNKKLDIKNGLCNIGPLVTVNVDGVITECDASIEHQKTLYNYGNVLYESIEDVFIKRNCSILKPKSWNRETEKIMTKYKTYDK